jgi:hypothetical protein
MSDDYRRKVIRLIRSMNGGPQALEAAMVELMAEDVLWRWPQSGEVIRGRGRLVEVEVHHPELPRVGITRVTGCGDVVVAEWSADYGDGRIFRNVSLVEFELGKVTGGTEYFGEPFDPPGWRSTLVDIEFDPGPEEQAATA